MKDPDGFNNDEWWQGLTEKYRKQKLDEQNIKFSNNPRESVSWYQCVAFTRWLNARLPRDVWPDVDKLSADSVKYCF